MKLSFQSGQRVHVIELEQDGNGYRAEIAGDTYDVVIVNGSNDEVNLLINGERVRAYIAQTKAQLWIHVNGRTVNLQRVAAREAGHRSASSAIHGGEQVLRAPMPGQVRAIQVQIGEQVEKGQTLMALEAMKMEIRIQAPRSGRVAKLAVQVGETVERDQVLAEIA
jgi:biotin carboxyl carrier protein